MGVLCDDGVVDDAPTCVEEDGEGGGVGGKRAEGGGREVLEEGGGGWAAEAEEMEGETDIADALRARANYLTRIGDKVCHLLDETAGGMLTLFRHLA